MLGNALDRACRNIISPQQYYHRIQLLCPKQKEFNGKTFSRIDFQVLNGQRKRLSAMILTQKEYQASDTILYLHGNGGSKLQVLGFVPLVCKKNVNVICFDFVGCGNSDAGYLTYGVNESRDIKTVLEQAKKHIRIRRLNIWGRSMGALAAIMYCERNHRDINGLILDSPFQFLQTPVLNVIKKETNVPLAIANVILFLIKNSIKSKLPIPVFSINYLEHFKTFSKNVPVLFLYSNSDQIVPSSETQKFYNACKGERDLLEIQQTHEEDRSTKVLQSVISWIQKDKTRKNHKIKLLHWTDSVQLETATSFFTC